MAVLPILGQRITMSENMWVYHTIASTSYKNDFQYAGVPLKELINENT